MRGFAHSVEFGRLIGIEQSLDLRVRAVADDPRQYCDRIQLWLYRLVERHDLTVLLLDQRVNRCLLPGRQLQLVRHPLAIGAGPAHLASMPGVHHPIGSEPQRTARDECAEEKHHCIAFRAVHGEPQCDRT